MASECLLLAFEESREQLFRNANGWGVDFERDGAGRAAQAWSATIPRLPASKTGCSSIQRIIDEFKPQRVALDSLSALERVGSIKAFREFVIGLTSFIKHQEITGLFTATTATLMGGTSITEAHISTLTDSIILLRYVEMFGEMKRGLTVLKMRGSIHDKGIREFNIDASGMHLGRRFRNVTGILSGAPIHMSNPDVDRAWSQADEEGLRRRTAAADGGVIQRRQSDRREELA